MYLAYITLGKLFNETYEQIGSNLGQRHFT